MTFVQVDKLCATRYITVIKACDRNSSYYYHEGSSFTTSDLGCLNALTAASHAKFTIAPLGLQYYNPVCEKFESENEIKKSSYLISFLSPSYQEKSMEEFSAKSTFLEEN